MSKSFGDAERHILNLFPQGTKFVFRNKEYTVILSDKPTCISGEPKTDIYILAKTDYNRREFKISFKKQNADFLENKIDAIRAEQIFGADWRSIITSSTILIADKFLSRKLIYKTKYKKTEAGAITLGWKFELMNKLSGELSGNMQLSCEQLEDVYAGINLSKEKQNAFVNGQRIENSGIANYILIENQAITSAQQAIDALCSIKYYVLRNPNIYFACKALNYRSLKQKYDGNRPLAVYVNWFIQDGKLASNVCFYSPFVGGDDVVAQLKRSLASLQITNTNDINQYNVENPQIIYQ